MAEGARDVIVVDASVAIALIRREPAAAQMRSLVRGFAGAAGRFLVPDVFWVEVANALVRRYAATSEEIVEALREIDELSVASACLDRSLLLVAIDLQGRHRLSAYDALYLALAEVQDARLLTLDPRLADAAGERAVRLDGMPPPRLAGETATYGSEPVDWARFGPYLARLRAEARDQVRATTLD
jgi:predicted nucleic acid-binding protein